MLSSIAARCCHTAVQPLSLTDPALNIVERPGSACVSPVKVVKAYVSLPNELNVSNAIVVPCTMDET